MNYWLVIVCFFINCVFCRAQSKPLYDIQAATITYIHSGSSYGTSTLFFDDFGNKKATQTIVRADSLNGQILTRYNEVFINNELVSDNSPGINTKNSPARSHLSNSITSTVFTSEMLNKLGFFKNGNSTVAGKTCTNYCSNSDTICLWNRIVLKATMHLSVVSIKMEATQIQLKPPPDSVFQFITEQYNH